MVWHGGSSAGSYLTDPTSPIPSHCAAIVLFRSAPVHQLSWLALYYITIIYCLCSQIKSAVFCLEACMAMLKCIWETCNIRSIVSRYCILISYWCFMKFRYWHENWLVLLYRKSETQINVYQDSFDMTHWCSPIPLLDLIITVYVVVSDYKTTNAFQDTMPWLESIAGMNFNAWKKTWIYGSIVSFSGMPVSYCLMHFLQHEGHAITAISTMLLCWRTHNSICSQQMNLVK